ncbi:MAG: MBL fold metallo-hydrolase [Chitinophagaceae bacterium]|nr:MBL fold metallo-hydrolase [Chitinophagaceae bacterium]
MIYKIFSAAIVLCCFASLQAQPGRYSKHFDIKELAPGVWAAINNDHYGHAICNAGIIDLGTEVLIFDPFMNIDAATDLKAAARQLTGKPVKYVINSHYHNDHIRGNQLFKPEATIISTRQTRIDQSIHEPQERTEEMKSADKVLAALQQQYKSIENPEATELPLWIAYFEGIVSSAPLLQLVIPDVTFDSEMWIYGSERDVQLVEYKNGHTASDCMLFLPKEGIVFAGDLFFVERHAFFGDGNPDEWFRHLTALEENPVYSTFVPGHGPVGSKKEIAALKSYITDLQKIVREEIDKGLADDAIIKSPVPEPYKSWKLSRFYAENLNFLVKTMRGK